MHLRIFIAAANRPAHCLPRMAMHLWSPRARRAPITAPGLAAMGDRVRCPAPETDPAPAPDHAPQHSETRSSGPSATERTYSADATAAPEQQPAVERAFTRAPERYQILGEFGRGGLGRVSRAHDRELGRDVAIKELPPHGHVKGVRFLREAMITARLEHPSIAPVHEAGRWPDGTPFYAMKLVAGR